MPAMQTSNQNTKQMKTTHRVAVIGSRGAQPTARNYMKIVNFLTEHNATEVVTGGAKGADQLAENVAEELGLKLTIYYPDYKRWKRSAPHLRNDEILANCEEVLALWDGESRGTASVMNKAEKLGKKCTVMNCE